MDINEDKEIKEFNDFVQNNFNVLYEKIESRNYVAETTYRSMLAAWIEAKKRAVPEWKDYVQQSPRIDGRYLIFINGEQLVADWKSPFGFADPIEGVAFIQELITHWAVLSADPVIVEQSHE